MTKIYTKVGDKGETTLVGGQKASKGDPRLDAYGTVDELNSALGLARSSLARVGREAGGKNLDWASALDADLETLQHWLFDLGGLLASLPADRAKLTKLTPEHVRWFEERIDAATALLKPLKCFILPAGTEPASQLHFARTVARRAERAMVSLGAELPELAIPFINRASDYLFTMARLCNRQLGAGDVERRKNVEP